MAYIFALVRMMVWEERHGGWQRRREWLSVANAARSALGDSPLAASDLVDKMRLDEIKRLTKLLHFRPDPYFRRLGLDLPEMGIGEDRKILPKGYVLAQLKQAK